LGSD
jgi:hypothetical protein